MRRIEEGILYIDGASRGNPGHAGIGIVLQDLNGKKVLEGCRYIGETTNNVAEYTALITGLKEAKRLGIRRLKVCSDSQLLVRQVRGEYRVRKDHLIRLYRRVLGLLKGFERCDIIYIPREANREADSLANRAVNEACPLK